MLITIGLKGLSELRQHDCRMVSLSTTLNPRGVPWISSDTEVRMGPSLEMHSTPPLLNWSFSHQLEFLMLSCSTCTLSFVVPLKPLIRSGQSIIYLVSCLLIYLSEFLFSN